jgi:hypothetical protein
MSRIPPERVLLLNGVDVAHDGLQPVGLRAARVGQQHVRLECATPDLRNAAE